MSLARPAGTVTELWKIQPRFLDKDLHFNMDETIDQVRSWIEECNFQNIDVDTCRLVRFAVYMGFTATGSRLGRETRSRPEKTGHPRQVGNVLRCRRG